MENSNVLVVLSGGMDSATVLAMACREYPIRDVYTLAFDYGQTHVKELTAARALANYFGVYYLNHRSLRLPLAEALGRSMILNPAGKYSSAFSSVPEGSPIAPSWIPARNAVLLSVAAGFAYTCGIHTIATGVNAVDWSGYPDCTPNFIELLERALRVGLADDSFKIWTPLIRLTKRLIVEAGELYGVPWKLTWSCYVGGAKPCGECGACKVRAKGFDEAGVADPLLIESS